MGDHFFSADPQSADVRRTVEARIWGKPYVFTTATGVFSRDRLDIGTAVLLREIEPPKQAGTFLDLGCGYGPIACALALEVPKATVWAVDVNSRALELTGVNAKAAGVAERVHAALPDDVPENLQFDQIWSNPAIHIGKPELHKMLLRWLGRLAPDGVAWFVVGKNLGGDSLQRWMTEQGYPCERIGSAKGFRVLRATR
ncbi:class I SAM-dependent methyltransferase [Kribbella pratensis]|uniref:Methyltransferase family protein n=1 Tax=Kribbella pratensis TaxID=2512112 RepID=A0A4R8BVG3_9ACTN|nr:methyltransferase [Kribbella pratensis]TDW65781.1 methyltransferase family protein [Kribbella pratensis]